MTEREKMEAGYLYLPSGELVEHRFKIQDLVDDYNKFKPSQVEERAEFLKGILGKVGKNINILPPFKCDYGYHIEVGDNFFANYNFIVLDGNYVRIGDNVWIAPNVGIYAAGHPLDTEERIAGLEYAFPVTIGDNVWIGGSTTIIGGVTIGKNSVIGAGSVVIRDIPEGVLAAGNPCRVIRKLTPADRDKYVHVD
ncbi:MAG: sugar O-acetyltransferase [Ruminococcaceae bacterium]|nr:sugar O-acetyltransferase [Oscillospiraceae bacterium]